MTNQINLKEVPITIREESQREKLQLVLDNFLKAGVSPSCLEAYLSFYEHSPHNYRPSVPCFCCNEDRYDEQKRLSTVVRVLRDTYNASQENIEAFLSRYAAREYLKTKTVPQEEIHQK